MILLTIGNNIYHMKHLQLFENFNNPNILKQIKVNERIKIIKWNDKKL